jgi:hypothetical protein
MITARNSGESTFSSLNELARALIGSRFLLLTDSRHLLFPAVVSSISSFAVDAATVAMTRIKVRAPHAADAQCSRMP